MRRLGLQNTCYDINQVQHPAIFFYVPHAPSQGFSGAFANY